MPLNNFNYLLSWSDFNKKSTSPTGVTDEFAQIHPEIIYSNFKLARDKGAVTISSVNIEISLVKKDCWVISSKMTDELLSHEQRHYDIVALSAREFYNNVLLLSAKSVKELQAMISALQTKFGQDAIDKDKKYDDQTDHGKNTKVQEAWDRKITAAKNNPKGTLIDLP